MSVVLSIRDLECFLLRRE